MSSGCETARYPHGRSRRGDSLPSRSVNRTDHHPPTASSTTFKKKTRRKRLVKNISKSSLCSHSRGILFLENGCFRCFPPCRGPTKKKFDWLLVWLGCDIRADAAESARYVFYCRVGDFRTYQVLRARSARMRALVNISMHVRYAYRLGNLCPNKSRLGTSPIVR